jgi:hypothetical protein
VTDSRWVQFPGRSRVLHLINEETTEWGQGEVAGSLIAWCGRISNESWLVNPPVATAHCSMCKKVVAKRGRTTG